MAKAKGGRDYKGCGRLLSIILVIIPVTAWILGFITRFREGKIVAGIIRLLGVGVVLWVFDIITMLFAGRIVRILPF